MEYVLLAVTLFIFMSIIFIRGMLQNRQDKILFEKNLRKKYGNYPEKEYKAEQFMSISHYFKNHTGSNQIDDITWNDLDMDRIFMQMNHTYSSAGEEYLYYTLRTLETDLEQLKKLEELIVYFQNHEDERVTLQLLFAKLGKTGKFSLYDYLEYLKDLGQRSNKKQIFLNLCYIPAIVLIFFSPLPGIFLFIGLMCMNMITYFRDKKEIEPYITSFMYIMRLLEAVDQLKSIKITVLEEEKKAMLEKRASLNLFKRNSFLAMSGGNGSGGNPLEIIMDYLRMTLHLDIMKFNSMLSEVNKHLTDIDFMVGRMGYIETTIAIGAFRQSLSYYCIPVFGDKMKMQEIYHPLIHNPVANSLEANTGILLTGSNASGKSTFLKTIAINAVLAQTIHTCTANYFESRIQKILSSMSLRDDLENGESYYIVEIKALKRILDQIDGDGLPVLCFVDEVLRGTNTVERIAASTQILKSLSKNRVLCFAATHDIELTHLLEHDFANYHFTEEVEQGDVLFNYKLLEGRATTRNAIKLLSMIGYEPEIIENATNMATRFVETGTWKL